MSKFDQRGRVPADRVPAALDRDDDADGIVVVTRRRLVRIALVAAETALRFERDAIPVDPVAWMLAPRRLLAGRAPIDACLSLEECERALLLHSLGLGLDADRAAFDEALMPPPEARLEDAA